MRPALSKCTPSQIVLFDFLAPRLLATPKSRRFINAIQSPCPTSSSRHSSDSATARTPVAKLSIFDVVGNPENDLSYHATQMRQCAMDTDVLGVWTAYRHIQNRKLRLVLGPEHYGATSFMLVRLFANIDTPEERSGEEMHAMEELAFVCAGAGYTDGLRQMLLWLLAKRDAEKVIKAYERFDQTVLELDKSGLERATIGFPDENDIDLSHPRLENPDINRMDIANIMAMAVAAHALRDSFYDALQLVLRRSSHRITRDNLRDLERELKACGDPEAGSLVAKALLYTEAAGMARLVQQPEVFKAHLRNLSREKVPVPRLEKVMQLILKGFSGNLVWAAINDSNRSATRPIVVTDRIWAYLVHAFIIAHREDIAERLWARILRIGIVPGTVMWNALLEGYRDTRQPQKLLNAWEAMTREGISFDASSYGAKLACLYQDRLRSNASKAFEDFKQTKPNKEDSLFVYNTVLNGHLSQKDLKSATKLLEEMKEHGPQPDVVSYNTFVGYHAKKGDLRGIADIVQQLTKAEVQPDVFTFTTILTAMLKARIPNGAERLLSVMQSMGVKQNVATYSAIIDSQVREGTRLGIRTAWELLQQMERMKDIKPNIVTYTSFLAGVHRSQELDKGMITTISSDVVQRMGRRGVRLRLGMYHILFKACLENPNPEGLDFFMDYYNMMVRDEIPFWHDTWYIILNGLVRREAWALASEMKDRMLKSDFRPMWGVLEMVKLIRRWETNNRN